MKGGREKSTQGVDGIQLMEKFVEVGVWRVEGGKSSSDTAEEDTERMISKIQEGGFRKKKNKKVWSGRNI